MAESDDLNPGDLDEIAATLTAAGFRSVEWDPARVNVPGVWLRLDGVDLETLAGLQLRVTAFLITNETEEQRVVPALAAMFNQAKPALRTLATLGPSADVVGVVLPTSSSPLPALSVPLAVLTTQETP